MTEVLPIQPVRVALQRYLHFLLFLLSLFSNGGNRELGARTKKSPGVADLLIAEEVH